MKIVAIMTAIHFIFASVQLNRDHLRYCSSVTFSIQSTGLPLSCSCMAMCVMDVVGPAPYQCFAPRRNSDNIALAYLLNRPSPLLNPALSLRYDQDLTERVPMPGAPRAGLKRSSKRSAQYFTGTVQIQQLFAAHDPSHTSGGNVTFESSEQARFAKRQVRALSGRRRRS